MKDRSALLALMASVDLDKAFKPVLALSALIASLTIGYYFVFILPSEAQNKLNLQAQQQSQQQSEAASNKQALDDCLAVADTNYNNQWKSECNSRSLPDDCSLPTYVATAVNNSQKSDKDDCFRQYPQK